jgi:hypothetical protein
MLLFRISRTDKTNLCYSNKIYAYLRNEKGHGAFRNATNVLNLDLFGGYINIHQSIFLRFMYFAVCIFHHIKY